MGFNMLEGVPEVSHCNWGFDDSHDIINLLPLDPFGMDIGATFTAFTSWLSDNEADGWNIFLNETMMFQGDPQNLWEFQRPKLVQLSSQEYCTSTNCLNISGGDPQGALLYALGYVGVQDLLSIEGVCKFLRDSVRGDPLLWKSIHIDESLNEKLSVPGCKRLSIEGIVNNLKDFKSFGAPRISSLRIGGRYVTEKHFKELKNLLVADECLPRKVHTPRFFRDDQSSCDDDRLIDIEMCPKCGNFCL
ncbi:hypothetical protein GIB67_034684 [Kingdonia uniflora]|uniref:F-box protein n=1 Tax=Kingdonia uniflora TaxID=39325 RepID=A0A7J7P0S5_9MAGN|nr:hypothetical protein GIB67_034684 [Kingdonia uniflora]